MDLSLTEFLVVARKWESEETIVNAYMETIEGSRFVTRLNGCNVVAQRDRIGITTASNQYEVSVALLATMMFKYSESEGENAGKPILEVRSQTWRLVLFE